MAKHTKPKKKKKEISKHRQSEQNEKIFTKFSNSKIGKFSIKHPKILKFILFTIFMLGLFILFYGRLFKGYTFLPPDTIAFRSLQPFIHDALSRGIYPQWNPYIFCCMPSFASLTAPFVDLPNTIVYGIVWFIRQIIHLNDYLHTQATLQFMLNFLLFGGFIYLFLRTKKIASGVALFSSVAMILMPQVVTYSATGHMSKLSTVVLIPMIVLLVDRLLVKRNLMFFSLTAMAVGVQLLRGHIQICYYTQLTVGLFFIVWAVRSFKTERELRKLFYGLSLLVGAVVLGLLLSSFLNLSVWEYSHYSIRGGETGGLDYGYATGWSFPPSEILTFFIPSFMGFGGETYWGPMPFTTFPMYFGLVTFILAGLAMVINRNRTTWFLAILATIALFVSFGKHFPVLYGPMFKLLPFFNKFRAPKMIHILLQISMVLLAGFGIQGLLDMKKESKRPDSKKVKRYLVVFGCILLLFFLILLLGKNMYMGWAARVGQNSSAAYDKALTHGFKSLLLFILTAGILLMTLKDKLNSRWLPALLVALLLFDLWGIDRQLVDFRPKGDERAYFAETPDVSYLKARKNEQDPFRIMPVADQRSSPNWYAYHFIQSVWGYHGAKPKRYQDLVDAFGIPRGPDGFLQKYLKMEGGRYSWKRPSELTTREMALQHIFQKLTNVRYIVSPYPLPDTTLQMVSPPDNRGGNGVFEYKDFLPRVYFPEKTITVQGKEAIMGYMTREAFDPLLTTVIEEKPPFQIATSDSNRAEITHYDLHHIEIDAQVMTPALMVLSESDYPPGWKIFVNDQERRIVKANYAFRGVFLEPGNHKVAFRYRSKMFNIGLTLTLSVFILLLAGIFTGWKITKNKEE